MLLPRPPILSDIEIVATQDKLIEILHQLSPGFTSELVTTHEFRRASQVLTGWRVRLLLGGGTCRFEAAPPRVNGCRIRSSLTLCFGLPFLFTENSNDQ